MLPQSLRQLSHPYLIVTLIIVTIAVLHLMDDWEHQQLLNRRAQEIVSRSARLEQVLQAQEMLIEHLSQQVGRFSDGTSDWHEVVHEVEKATSELQSSPSHHLLINGLEEDLAQLRRLTGADEDELSRREELRIREVQRARGADAR